MRAANREGEFAMPDNSVRVSKEDEHILVVDDEPDILSLLVYHLSRTGYRVTTAVKGSGALNAARAERPDLMVLDLMLPEMDGYEVLERLRSDNRTASIPVILLTARRGQAERVRGFEVGADDYVTKPFDARELLLRVEAVLRRAKAEPVAASRQISAGPVSMDRVAHRVYAFDQELDLTPLEYRLLEVLLERRGRAQSRQQLMAAAWDDPNIQRNRRTVDMHMARLRTKLGKAALFLETVRGIGYRFQSPDR